MYRELPLPPPPPHTHTDTQKEKKYAVSFIYQTTIFLGLSKLNAFADDKELSKGNYLMMDRLP